VFLHVVVQPVVHVAVHVDVHVPPHAPHDAAFSAVHVPTQFREHCAAHVPDVHDISGI
jgi:hypothetical protein